MSPLVLMHLIELSRDTLSFVGAEWNVCTLDFFLIADFKTMICFLIKSSFKYGDCMSQRD